MARTFAERVGVWEARLETYRSQRSLALMRATGDLSAFTSWLQTLVMAAEILAELKEQKEQADGYQASRDLLVEHFDFVKREGFEALQRVSWLEENARRLRSYVEEQATCGWCGCYEKCEEDCVGPATIEREAEMKKAREALAGFAL